jgi:SAM-dependent methyltransferase
MDGYGPATYGDIWADLYDDLYPGPGADQVEFLVRRAGGGPVLELAIGSGRVALPVMAAGVPIHGVEISGAMINRLRAKPGGADIPIVASDMTDFTVEESYPLAILGANTLFAPLEEHLQRGIFRSVAAALAPDGAFVVECFVPDLGRFDRGQTVRVNEVTLDRVVVEYTIHDAANQTNRTMVEIRWRDGRSAVYPVVVRYMWPEEIDAMAASSDLHLAERFEWYDESPFTQDSPRHVSVYGRD